MSYYNNDYLRVVLYGYLWGSFYTTWLSIDKNSLAIFRIDKYANV